MSNPWENIPSGRYGPPVPYILDVLNPHFAYSPTDQNNPDVARIMLQGRTDDPEWEEFTIELRVGKDWEVVSDGMEIRHSNPRKTLPDGKTQYGYLCASIGRYKSSDNKLQELLDVLGQRGDPKQAEVWKGLRLVIGEERDSFQDQDTGEDREFFRTVITGFEGVVSDEEMASLGNAREEQLQGQIDQLIDIAKNSADHAAFANRALSEVKPTIRDDVLIARIMNAGEDGFYHEYSK